MTWIVAVPAVEVRRVDRRWTSWSALALLLCVLGGGFAGMLSTVAGRPGGSVRPADRGVPVSLRGPVSELIGADNPSYRLHAGVGDNAAQHFGLRIEAGGVTITSDGRALSVASAVVNGRRVRLQRSRASANRVAFRGPAVTESFANGPLGLEQSFELRSGPASGGSLTIALPVSRGWALTARSGAVLLSDGPARLRYCGLSVLDARGRRLRSWLTVAGRRIVIGVDTHGATYPLRVDPFFQQASLGPGTVDALYGYSVASSGSVIVVGDPADARGPASATDPGAVYVFTKPTGGWSQAGAPAVLTPSDGVADDRFGTAVSISSNGSTIAVGAPNHGSGGAVYVFSEPSGGWATSSDAAELTVSGAADPLLSLGAAVALSGDGSTLVAGDPDYDYSRGAAFVYARPAGGWATSSAPAAELVGPTTTADCPEFGSSVTISSTGSTIAAGQPDLDQDSCTSQAVGSASVFGEPASGWADGAVAPAFDLLAPIDTLAPAGGVAGDQFGETISMSGSAATIVVGAPDETVGTAAQAGAAYVFSRPSSGWTGTPAQVVLSGGSETAGQGFADAVSISTSGDSIDVADPELSGAAASAADIFPWNGSTAGTPETAVPGSGIAVTRVAALDGTVITAADGEPADVFNEGLGIDVAAPANGATYTQNQDVDAAYSCTPPSGATIESCGGSVADGSAIPTSTVGPASFEVTATDSFGDRAVDVVDYTVAAAGGTSTSPASGVTTQATTPSVTTTVPTAAQIAAEDAAWLAAFEVIANNPQNALNVGNILNDGGFSSNNNFVPDPGLITLFANTNTITTVRPALARAGRRPTRGSVEVLAFSHRFTKAGHYTLHIRLTAAGRRLLRAAQRRHVRVTLNWTVTYRPLSGASQTRRFVTRLVSRRVTRSK